MKTMKVIGLLLAAMIAVLAFTGTANAERKSKIEKGDTLWKYSRTEWGTGFLWNKIAERNNITDQKKLRIGQQIVIPDIEIVEIRNHNTSPYGAKALKGDAKVIDFIQKTKLDENVRNLLIQQISSADPEPYILMKGEEAKYTSDGKGVYGNGFTTYRYNWEKVDQLKAWRWSAVIESCGNASLNWEKTPEEKVEKIEIPVQPAPIIAPEPAPEVPQKIMEQEIKLKEEQMECPGCGELELMSGIAVWVHDPSGEGKTKGNNIWIEGMYWDNFEIDCSGEYWGGIGGIASAHTYKASYFPSKGNGWRAAGEAGLKRIYSSGIDEKGLEYSKSWQLKARLGWEESHWENPDTVKEINQKGPVWGLYGEHIREIVDERTYLILQAESWWGLNQKISGQKEWNLKPDSKNYFSFFLGIDQKLRNNLTLRIGPGYDYQGWDEQHVFAPQAQLIYDLPNQNGRLAAGFYGKIYSNLNPTLGILGRYESGNLLLRKSYSGYRKSQYKFTGIGINADKKIMQTDASISQPVLLITPALESVIPINADE